MARTTTVITVRVPDNWPQLIETKAARKGISRNAWLVAVIKANLRDLLERDKSKP